MYCIITRLSFHKSYVVGLLLFGMKLSMHVVFEEQNWFIYVVWHRLRVLSVMLLSTALNGLLLGLKYLVVEAPDHVGIGVTLSGCK